MTEKLTAAEIERLRPVNVGPHYPWPVDSSALNALCDMASASLASAGDGEVEGLIGELREKEKGWLWDEGGSVRINADKLSGRAADTLARQQAEIASLRAARDECERQFQEKVLELGRAERRATELQDELDQALSKVSELAHKLKAMEDRTFAAEARVAELTRAADIAETRLALIAGGSDRPHLEHCPAIASTALHDMKQALTAAQGEGKKCATCDDTGSVAAEIETDNGPVPCPYIGAPCPDCAAQGEEKAPTRYGLSDEEIRDGLGAFGPSTRCDEPTPNSTQGPGKCDSGEVVTPTAAIREAMGALEDCANDLAALVEAQYRGTLGYPAMKRKYKRDMGPVESARAAHAKLTEIIEGGGDEQRN